jgi:RNA polymerase sigma-70 factor (ECF subfamily)
LAGWLFGGSDSAPKKHAHNRPRRDAAGSADASGVQSSDPQIERDTKLIAAVRAGDTKAYREIFDQYAIALLRFASAQLGSRDRAEDIVQQVFASIWVRHEQWQVTTSIGAYLFRAVRNLAARDFRDRGIKESSCASAINIDTAPLLVSGEAPDAKLAEDDLRATLTRALAAMPPRPREVFLLSRGRCLTYHEIATTLGISTKTVELHMARALAVLRDALADWRQ